MILHRTAAAAYAVMQYPITIDQHDESNFSHSFLSLLFVIKGMQLIESKFLSANLTDICPCSCIAVKVNGHLICGHRDLISDVLKSRKMQMKEPRQTSFACSIQLIDDSHAKAKAFIVVSYNERRCCIMLGHA